MKRLQLVAIMLLPLIVAACGSSKPSIPGVKIGKPYQVQGHWYNPAHQPGYDEVGIASWYGPGFHGHYTASGEEYDQGDMTAAHTTLPMPSMVRVTNLTNGKSTIVRINDRGPFAEDRIIDLSKAAAKELDIIRTGTAKVRVQYLPVETAEFLREHNVRGAEKILALAGAARSPNQIAAEQARVEGVRPIYRVTYGEPKPLIGEVTITDTTPAVIIKDEVEQVEFTNGADAVPPPDQRIVTEGVEEVFVPAEDPQPAPMQIEGGELSRAADRVEDVSIEQAPLSEAMDQVSQDQMSHYEPVAAVQSAPSEQGLFVQAGSFSVRENAMGLVKKLSVFGDARLAEKQVNNKTWYRVRIGPVASRRQGQEILEKLLQMHLADARIIEN